MTPYLLVFSFCLILFIIGAKRNKIFLFISCIVLSLFAGFRDIGVGTDTTIYSENYFKIASSVKDLSELFSLEDDDASEKGYLFLNWFGTFLSSHYWIALFLTELCICSLFYLGVFRLKGDNKINIYFVSISFFFLIFNPSLNYMRQYCAVMISFLAFSYYIEKKYLKYTMFVIVAQTFHTSAFVSLIIPFIYEICYMKSNKEKLVVLFFLLVFGFILFYGYYFVLEFIGNLGVFKEAYMERYGELSQFEGKERIGLVPLFISLWFLFLMLLSYRNNVIDRNQFFFHFVINLFYIGCLFLSLYSLFLFRIGFYFYVIDIFFFILELSSLHTNKILKITSSVFLFLSWVYLYMIVNDCDTNPYTSKILGI